METDGLIRALSAALEILVLSFLTSASAADAAVSLVLNSINNSTARTKFWEYNDD